MNIIFNDKWFVYNIIIAGTSTQKDVDHEYKIDETKEIEK